MKIAPERIALPVILFLIALVDASAQRAEPIEGEPSLRDTLFVLDDTFIEVDLSHQRLVQHFRDGRLDTFLVSTGDGIGARHVPTRTGIFTIKSKSRRHVSSHFDVMMYDWMPFDGGIGFHSLGGTSYYKYLGVRPSSAGCVRMSRESARKLYAHVAVGTPVIVHDGRPARVLAFADPDDETVREMETIEFDLLERRLEAVEQGRNDAASFCERLALPAGGVFFGRIPVGALPQP